jgi:hypothetical protein
MEYLLSIPEELGSILNIAKAKQNKTTKVRVLA